RRDHGRAAPRAPRVRRSVPPRGDPDRARQAPARELPRRHGAGRFGGNTLIEPGFKTMAITLQDALQRTIEHREIFHDEMLSVMRGIMSGEVTPVMIAALTVGLRVKKETIGEIAAAAQVMREFATKVDVPDRKHLVDIVGTGGDASHTLHISTTSQLIPAALLSSSRSAPTSCWRGRRSRSASPSAASDSCSRRTITAR